LDGAFFALIIDMVNSHIKKANYIMDKKSNNLIKGLGNAYKDKVIKENAELKKLIEGCARPLMGNTDDKVYFEVITKLSRGVTNYYRKHHETIPEAISKIYKQIREDVPEKSVEGKRLRRKFADFKLVTKG